MTAIGKFARLTWRERALFCGALVLLPAAALGLRMFGVEWEPFRLSGAASGSVRRGDAVATRRRVKETARIVAAASHYSPYHASCLPRSLVLRWLLHRQGIASDLRLGVRRDGGDLAAHAWVEYEGVPLIDSPAVHERYATLNDGEPRAAASRGAP